VTALQGGLGRGSAERSPLAYPTSFVTADAEVADYAFGQTALQGCHLAVIDLGSSWLKS